ncbi:MAG: hypothetical protein RL032_97 [Pseudomonadota bacterium]
MPPNGQPFTSVKARLTIPAGEPTGEKLFPVVIVLQACGGLDDNVTTDWPNFWVNVGLPRWFPIYWDPATLCPLVIGSPYRWMSACATSTVPLPFWQTIPV